MKAPEKLVQLHGSVIGNREIIEREIFILRDHASLTVDVAVKFAEWVANECVIFESEHACTRLELFNYFINNEYKPE